jgi:hypothetical protein
MNCPEKDSIFTRGCKESTAVEENPNRIGHAREIQPNASIVQFIS